MADPLQPYLAKRDLEKSGEPGASKARSATPALSFVVQKHAARRLHFDFRLELDGVLKSWAVARGPSLVPAEKRLAVHVEDHPLDYASFEGNIPEGNYGAGEVIVWDQGTWEPLGDPRRGLEKGHLDFRLHGQRLSGEWHLVRLRGKPGEKRENWLLIKAHDEAAREPGEPAITEEEQRSVLSGRSLEDIAAGVPAEAAKPRARAASSRAAAKPQAVAKSRTTTRPGPDPKASAGAPAKADPPRARAPRRKPADQPATSETDPAPEPRPSRARGRRGASFSLPDFVSPCLAELQTNTPAGPDWIHEIKFDGYRMQAAIAQGSVVLRTRKGLDWTAKFAPSAFVEALSRLEVGAALIDGEVVVEDSGGVSDFSALQADLAEGRKDRFVYWVFDLLHLDGVDLTPLPLSQRKERLSQLVHPGHGALRLSEHMDEGGEALLRHACRLSLEGIVSKLRGSRYRSGRTGDWVKTKCSQRQEFVIGGFTPSTASRRAVGALALGVYDEGKLVYAGRVGSGLTASGAAELWTELDAMRIEKPPFAGTLAPEARRGGVRWVRPELVAEVEFRGRTGTDTLRHAVFRGIRRDKPAEEVRREDTPSPAGAVEAASSVELTHPDRMFWPEAGVTKQGLYDFYAAIWPRIAPHITERPLSLVRCPGGVTQECFFQKHAWNGLDRNVLRGRDRDGEEFLFIREFDGLAALVQAGVLEIHPWGSHVATMEQPDVLTFDLDPGEGVSWGQVIEAAFDVRRELQDRGLTSFVKTSGGKGLHVVVPIVPREDWETAKAFTSEVAETLARARPDRYTAALAKAARTGRIFIDYLRNGRGATAVAAYSTRRRPTAGVSTPIGWEELGPEMTPDRFRVTNLLNRLDHLGQDPWESFFRVRQELPHAPARPATSGKRSR